MAGAAHAAHAAHAVRSKKGGGRLHQDSGYGSLIIFVVLALAWLSGFASRLFAVIRFESIIHEFDPW
jgi:hypothetical protein